MVLIRGVMDAARTLLTASAPSVLDQAQIQHRLEGDLERVRKRLRALLIPSHPKILIPIADSVAHTGRLFRPTLVLMSSYLSTGELSERTAPEVIDAAAAIEMLHVATLYHDDIIDGATTRRGRPTANVKYGTPVALLVGDYLLARCMQVSGSVGMGCLMQMCEALLQACAGQLLETKQLFDATRSEDDYLAAISGKTACLMRTATAIGAMQPGVAEGVPDAMAAFGHNLGMAFQIWDDILDLYSKDTGKESAKDILNGVYTLPIIYAMDDLPERLRRSISEGRSTAAERQEIVAAIHACGAVDRASEVAQRYVTAAIQVVTAHPALADRVPVVERCLVELVSRLAPRHPAVRVLLDGPGPDVRDI
jgi:heptaprenyl diphosphate synthase